jgi:hypothetical protein
MSSLSLQGTVLNASVVYITTEPLVTRFLQVMGPALA